MNLDLSEEGYQPGGKMANADLQIRLLRSTSSDRRYQMYQQKKTYGTFHQPNIIVLPFDSLKLG